MRVVFLIVVSAFFADMALAHSDKKKQQQIKNLQIEIKQYKQRVASLNREVVRLYNLLKKKLQPGKQIKVKPQLATEKTTKNWTKEKTYYVKKGDSLYLIAKRYKVPLSKLINLNKTVAEKPLQVGQKIKLP